jgi:hypothetical protein
MGIEIRRFLGHPPFNFPAVQAKATAGGEVVALLGDRLWGACGVGWESARPVTCGIFHELQVQTSLMKCLRPLRKIDT